MNKLTSIILASVLALLPACTSEKVPDFALGSDNIEAGPDGLDYALSMDSPSAWVAKTSNPWITVSPANGRGSTLCHILIDSALTTTPREGLVRFELLESGNRKDVKVVQKGYDYLILPEETSINLKNYAPTDEREFEIEVYSNTPFEVVIPTEDQKWLKAKVPELVLDRGMRPRKSKVSFSWESNFEQNDRQTSIVFKSKDPQKEPASVEPLEIVQAAADPIEIGIAGDSLALIAISRSMNCLASYNTSERMEHWNDVKVWKSGPNKGRVRSASFYMFETKEGLPFQVKYLTAAEELCFFGNSNTFLKELDPGLHICELTQLKRLQIGAYGLVSLPDEFARLKNLEFLDISGNNFASIPSVLTPENFPNLRSLILNANQRNVVYDLSNTTKKELGGLIDESDTAPDGKRSFPIRLLLWENLDTLVLSVNYLQGSIPSLEDDARFPKWTAEEVNACDTLPARIIGLPKVLPHAKLVTMNLNRLSGELPDWLLYHPCLDLWVPDALVFPQEGKDKQGNNAGFSNTPASLDYYYAEYVNKRYNPNRPKE